MLDNQHILLIIYIYILKCSYNLGYNHVEKKQHIRILNKIRQQKSLVDFSTRPIYFMLLSICFLSLLQTDNSISGY
jgi:hypothetical protein